MRRILLFCLVLLVHVAGYSHAPGTYPEEETRSNSDFEVPKNPYESSWTGYEFYYEKEPKKMPSSGQMPAFQSIESVSSDRESPDDPEEFRASGAESAGHKTTTPPSTTSAPLVEVAPSSTTGTVSVSTRVPPTTTTITTTGMLPMEQLFTSTTAPSSPPSGDDLQAADNLAMYPGVQLEKDENSYEPKNLLTKMVETKKIALPPVTNAPKNPEGAYDSVPEAVSSGGAPGSYDAAPAGSSYGSSNESHPKTASKTPSVPLKSGDGYDDLGGPSGYSNVASTTSSPGNAPGAYPRAEVTTKPPANPDYSSSDLGYGTGDSGSGSSTEKIATTTSKPEPYDIPFKPSPAYMNTDIPSPGASDPNSGYGSYDSESPNPTGTFTRPSGTYNSYSSHKDTVSEPRGPYSPENDPYPAPKIPMASRDRGEIEDPYGSFSKPFNHVGTVSSSKFAPGTAPDPITNSNNAISARDPYDHFGTVPHHAQQKHRTSSTDNGDSETFEDEQDGGYESNGVVVPDRSTSHSISTGPSSITDVRAQISEIDRIVEDFENSAREPVEYEHKITSESSKGIIAEAGKDIAKKFGRKAHKCCSCCDEKQPVSRQIETKIEPTLTQKMVSPGHPNFTEEPVQNFIPLQSTVGGSAYVQPQAPPQPIPQQTQYQQPFQQYQPQYPQSYPYQQPQQSCGCQPQPQNCCAPPAPCCLPTIPCCPPIPCCPQPKICCNPQPICLPPPTCCQINFQLPTLPICGRACPSCPCRRRVHKTHRLKRHAINSNCNRCSAAGEPWKALVHHREKRAAPGCASGFSTMQQNSCSTCGASHLRSARVKRMGCLPCLGRKKRDTEENSHIRVKRMGCLPCLGRKKRSALSSNCSQCNSLGHLFNRYKRSLFGCSPCSPAPACPCGGRKKRSVTMKIVKRAPVKNQCDASCCDYSKCPNRQKKDVLVPIM